MFVRFAWEQMRWWELLPTALEVLLASVTGGLLVCGSALWLTKMWRTLTGTHRCIACDRKQHAPGFCEDCRIRHDTNAA